MHGPGASREREPRPYTYVFTPTGDELPEMIAHMNRVEKMLGRGVLSLTNGTLASVIAQNRMLPCFHARFCTRILKLKPYGVFMKAAAPCISYVGLRDDEDDREGNRSTADGIGQDFPFQRWGWGLDEVWAFLNGRGICIPERTDCARCPYQKLGEWYNLWLAYPEIFKSAIQDEKQYGQTFRSPSRDSWPTSLEDLATLFDIGIIPGRSLRMMEQRRGMCRQCSL